MKRVLLGTMLALTSWMGVAADFPSLTIPEGVGVNIHFVAGHEQDLNAIAAAGFKFIRMDFSWEETEREKGKYDWAAYDELTANLEKRGIRAIYILAYGSALYEGAEPSKNPLTNKEEKQTASPRHPESVAAFAAWAGEAAKHFSGKRVIWEIWNEPNIFFWKPKPDVKEYTTLALATAKAVRAADPKATIIGPASSEFPWEFLESFLSSGVLEYLDGVSVHPYRDYKKSPETAYEDYFRLREMIHKYAPADKKEMPIISGEWGYTTSSKGISLDKQAAFIVRQQLSNLIQRVPISIWYDWKNDGTDPNDWESNFGTVMFDLTPKPSYLAIQTMTRQLAGYRDSSGGTADKDHHLVMAGPNGQVKMIVWTTGDKHTATLDLDNLARKSKVTAAVNWKGESFQVKADGTKIQLEVEARPVYLSLE